ncbi:MAG: Rieske 2Fe-2S domain-containing protein [Ilumatobacter sp.]|uniref:Rieske 2Fe-2S domain-containing protein n=1 Tax=Ilumatobacter sp. TaxID=1967498 RepID=UPI00391B237C
MSMSTGVSVSVPSSEPHVLDHPVFRRFWFPLVHVTEVAHGPVARMLLGEELVIWSPQPGVVAAASDRCPHRDARLSTGWIESCGLVCPYHGWGFGEDGAATRIPQVAEGAAFPSKAALTMYPAVERYGWVWVTMSDDPILDIPDIHEYDAVGWRTIREPESAWDCTALHLIDNNIDPAHIAYVHEKSFGTPSKPEVEIPEVEHHGRGMRLTYEVEVEGRPGEIGTTTVRSTVNRLHGPFLMLNRITYPDGLVHLMVKACTPATATTTRQLQMVLRNDTEAQRPASDIVDFDHQVWGEDQAVLERCWTDYRLDLTGNVHLKTDKASIEYRRWLQRLVTDGDTATLADPSTVQMADPDDDVVSDAAPAGTQRGAA